MKGKFDSWVNIFHQSETKSPKSLSTSFHINSRVSLQAKSCTADYATQEFCSLLVYFFFFFFYCSTKDSFLRFLTIKQDVTQGRSDSAGQMAGKKIKPVYE